MSLFSAPTAMTRRPWQCGPGSAISKVTVRFKGGSADTMQPVGGWAILADTGSQSAGVVTGYNAKGQAVATGTLPSPSNPGGPPEVSTPTL